MNRLRVLDLFSGTGGFSLGLERTGGFETIAFCEIDPFCRRVLAKHWPDTPCFKDVRTLTKDDIDGAVDVITGGYPCQPFSQAGKRKGAQDDRHLWPEFARLVHEFRPAWVIGENVAGHISLGLDSVLADLEGLGYAARAFVVPACAVAAPHRRDRVWIVGHAGQDGEPNGAVDAQMAGLPIMADAGRGRCGGPQEGQIQQPGRAEAERAGEDVAYAHGNHENRRGGAVQMGRLGRAQEAENNGLQRRIEWPPEPGVGRVVNGLPGRVDRLKALGNAVVPQIPEMIGHAILAAQCQPLEAAP